MATFRELSPNLSLPQLIRELNDVLLDFSSDSQAFASSTLFDTPEFDKTLSSTAEVKIGSVSVPKNRKLMIVASGLVSARVDGLVVVVKLRRGDAVGTVLDQKSLTYQTDGANSERFAWVLTACDEKSSGTYTLTASSTNAAGNDKIQGTSVSVFGVP